MRKIKFSPDIGHEFKIRWKIADKRKWKKQRFYAFSWYTENRNKKKKIDVLWYVTSQKNTGFIIIYKSEKINKPRNEI